jgi:UDP-N-acetylmuramoylalanine--D-glutamate ligase
MITDWKNKKVGVLGVGVEGLSSARHLASKGALVTVLDENEEKDIDPDSLRAVRRLGVKTVFGKDSFGGLTSFEMALRSPGISLQRKELQEASQAGVVITSQTKLFFDLCPCPIVGVTGTKGKGTTASLVYEMLKKSRRDLSDGRQRVYLGGNIGRPPFEFLDKLSPQSIVVLELSSFQLEDLRKSPFIAVVLMIVPEHLGRDNTGTQNYHESMEDYVEAKRNILRYQDVSDYAILNRDYAPSNESDIYTNGQVFYVSRERSTSEQGAYIKDGAIWLRMRGTEWKIIEVDKILLVGKHNWENAAAAAMASTLAGARREDITYVLSAFKGLEHRLELVREANGVRYYDDSFSTTPETAIAAIESFTEPKVLILGGSSKKSDFRELGEVIRKAENIRAIIGIGEEWSKIKSQISNLKSQSHNLKLKSEILFIEGARNMETIVKAAAKIARPGDVVLLSPACASFGMFRNYKDRGEQFKKEVMRLSSKF